MSRRWGRKGSTPVIERRAPGPGGSILKTRHGSRHPAAGQCGAAGCVLASPGCKLSSSYSQSSELMVALAQNKGGKSAKGGGDTLMLATSSAGRRAAGDPQGVGVVGWWLTRSDLTIVFSNTGVS